MKKNFPKLLLAVACLLSCFLITTSATEPAVVATGYCGGEGDGTNLTWTFTDDGTLTISGTGTMGDWGDDATGSPTWWEYGTSITNVVIENGVTNIGQCAFSGCWRLQSITIPGSVTAIGAYAFDWCEALTSVSIPDSVTEIGEYAFYNCLTLQSVEISSGVTKISNGIFCNCRALECVTLPRGVTEIGENAFSMCEKLTDITIPSGVTKIGNSAFSSCGFQSITIPNSVTEIGEEAFTQSKLTSVTIPYRVTEIGAMAFAWCPLLNEVFFAGNAPSIGKYAFSEVTATCYYPVGNTTWTTGVMQDYEGNLTWEKSYDIVTPPAVAGTITDTGRTIALEGEIYINQYVTIEGFEGVNVEERGGLLVWNSAVTEDEAVCGNATVAEIHEGLTAYNGNYFQSTDGIAAKEYADEVWMRVYVEVADGEYVYGPLIEYSVQDYCEHKIDTAGYSDTLKKTCAALLHYGAMAQQMFSYNITDLANANILDSYPAPDWMN